MVLFEKLLLAVLVLDALAMIAVPIVYFFALRHPRHQSISGPARPSDRSSPSGGEPPSNGL